MKTECFTGSPWPETVFLGEGFISGSDASISVWYVAICLAIYHFKSLFKIPRRTFENMTVLLCFEIKQFCLHVSGQHFH